MLGLPSFKRAAEFSWKKVTPGAPYVQGKALGPGSGNVSVIYMIFILLLY